MSSYERSEGSDTYDPYATAAAALARLETELDETRHAP